MPTPWERPRAVIELGGGRPLRDSPLGGGRAHLEGAQQPLGLKLGTLWPRSHDLPSSLVPLSGPAPQMPGRAGSAVCGVSYTIGACGRHVCARVRYTRAPTEPRGSARPRILLYASASGVVCSSLRTCGSQPRATSVRGGTSNETRVILITCGAVRTGRRGAGSPLSGFDRIHTIIVFGRRV